MAGISRPTDTRKYGHAAKGHFAACPSLPTYHATGGARVSSNSTHLFFPGARTVELHTPKSEMTLCIELGGGFWEVPVVQERALLSIDGQTFLQGNLIGLLRVEKGVQCAKAVLAREVVHSQPLDITSTFHANDLQVAFLGESSHALERLPVYFVWTFGEEIFEISPATIEKGRGVRHTSIHASGLFLQSNYPKGEWQLDVISLTGRSLAQLGFRLVETGRMPYGTDLKNGRRQMLDLRM